MKKKIKKSMSGFKYVLKYKSCEMSVLSLEVVLEDSGNGFGVSLSTGSWAFSLLDLEGPSVCIVI